MDVHASDTLSVLARVARRLDGCEAYLVGGAIRDALLARPTSDLDIAVAGDPRPFAAAAAAALGSHVVAIGTGDTALLRLPLREGYIDIVPLRGDLTADLAARDFTVNALALPLAAIEPTTLTLLLAQLIDHARGLEDVRAGVLRPVSPHSIEADPARALRAVRLAVELDFTLAPETTDAIAGSAPRLSSVAAERVGDELLRLFALPGAGRGARLMDASGLLAACFPELDAGREVEQRPVHRYRVLEHQLAALDWMDVLIAEQEPAGRLAHRIWGAMWEGDEPHGTGYAVEPPHSPLPVTGEGTGVRAPGWHEVRAHLRQQGAALRLATLLHDVGKPATLREEPDGRTRFFGHSEVGAALAREALTRWRLPGALVERVALLIEQHLRPGQVASPGQPPTPRALHRFHHDLGDATADACFLFLADSLATAGADVLAPRWPAYVAHVRGIIAWAPPPAALEVRRLVDGHAVMRATGLGPGPEIGRILAAVQEAANAGEVATEDEALALARELQRHSDRGAAAQ